MSKNPILKRVDGLQFSVLGPDEIRDQSVVEVTKYETYDKNVPVVKGLFDLRMGTTDMGKKCNTCGLNNKGCPGHFGHIELARPVYHYHFIDMTVKILKCVCCSCGKLLVNRDQRIAPKTLVQLGYNRTGDSILFVGEFVQNTIHFPNKGFRFPNPKVQEHLSTVSFRVPTRRTIH